MQILIVQQSPELASIWRQFLERQGLVCMVATTQGEAIEALQDQAFDALVLDMELAGGAFSVADFATYRNPDIPIIAVTARNFFSDGSIFQLIPNARSLLREPLRPEDMAALVEHYAERSAGEARRRSSGG